MTHPGLTPDDQREIQAPRASDVQQRAREQARMHELAFIFFAAIVPLAAVTVARCFEHNETAQLIATYGSCIALVVGGWGLIRAVLFSRNPSRRGTCILLAASFVTLLALVIFFWPEPPRPKLPYFESRPYPPEK